MIYKTEEELVKLAENCDLSQKQKYYDALSIIIKADAEAIETEEKISYLGNNFLGYERINKYRFRINKLDIIIRTRFAYGKYQYCIIETINQDSEQNKKFYKKCQKLGITDDVANTIDNCKCFEDGEEIKYSLRFLNKLRKKDIKEELSYYFDVFDDGEQMSTFCRKLGIEESEIAFYYAMALCESGYVIAYPIIDDIILILE